MLISEVLQSPVQYKWTRTSPSFYQAQFTIDEWNYTIDFRLQQSSQKQFGILTKHFWLVNFKVNNPSKSHSTGYGVEKTGVATTVFPTVINIIQDFIQIAKPKIIRFEAAEDSRQRLYDRLIRMYTSKYKVKTFMKGADKVYELYI
jgi:hypothetical protein